MSLGHAFVSGIADEAVTGGRVQPSHWNAAHVFGGGSTGALLYRDEAAPDGAAWRAAAGLGAVLVSAGAGAAPVWSADPVVSSIKAGAIYGAGAIALVASDELPIRVFEAAVEYARFHGDRHAMTLGLTFGALHPPEGSLALEGLALVGTINGPAFGSSGIVLGAAAVAPAGLAVGTAALFVKTIGGVARLYALGADGVGGEVTAHVSSAAPGDPAMAAEGVIAINTADKTVKMFAGGAWRALANW